MRLIVLFLIAGAIAVLGGLLGAKLPVPVAAGIMSFWAALAALSGAAAARANNTPTGFGAAFAGGFLFVVSFLMTLGMVGGMSLRYLLH